eukprot:scaffold647_cov150-Skeletonema_menzelii.AAC.37
MSQCGLRGRAWAAGAAAPPGRSEFEILCGSVVASRGSSSLFLYPSIALLDRYCVRYPMITDVFPPLAFCFGFIVTRLLSSRTRGNERSGSERATGFVDVELGESAPCDNTQEARTPPQSSKEVSISFSNNDKDRELRMTAALGRIPRKQRREKRSVYNAPTMRWNV